MKFNLFILLFLFNQVAQAQELPLLGYANKVLKHRLNMSEPTNDLQKWERDMWTFSSYDCYHHEKVAIPEELRKIKIYLPGSYSTAKSLNSYCSNLSKGPNLQCFNFKTSQPPFGFPLYGMSPDYLYIEKGKKVKNNSTIMLGGYCQLTKEYQKDEKQFFTGIGKFNWTQELSPSKINTQNGEVNVILGNALLSVDGLKETFPVIVIQR